MTLNTTFYSLFMDNNHTDDIYCRKSLFFVLQLNFNAHFHYTVRNFYRNFSKHVTEVFFTHSFVKSR